MRQVRLTTELPDAEADALEGHFLDERYYDQLIDYDADVYRPDGQPLLKLRRGVIPLDICEAAYMVLRRVTRLSSKSDNRGAAAGVESDKTKFGPESDLRVQRIKLSGQLSNTTYAKAVVESSVIGYMDRYPRIPYCRQTAFNLKHFDLYQQALPYIRAVNAVFLQAAPDRYAAQEEMIKRTHPDFYIAGTAFTTITVNRNWQTATHKDAGDYPDGFGVMSALTAGAFGGCFLVFPKYRVAVDFRTTDVLLADVHQWHGNTPIRPEGEYERISCVFYYRRNMHLCGSAEDEIEWAKKHSGKGKLYDR